MKKTIKEKTPARIQKIFDAADENNEETIKEYVEGAEQTTSDFRDYSKRLTITVLHRFKTSCIDFASAVLREPFQDKYRNYVERLKMVISRTEEEIRYRTEIEESLQDIETRNSRSKEDGATEPVIRRRTTQYERKPKFKTFKETFLAPHAYKYERLIEKLNEESPTIGNRPWLIKLADGNLKWNEDHLYLAGLIRVLIDNSIVYDQLAGGPWITILRETFNITANPEDRINRQFNTGEGRSIDPKWKDPFITMIDSLS